MNEPADDPLAPAEAAHPNANSDTQRRTRDWRYWVGGTGRVLLIIGVLMFGFLAYQLWGTGIEYRQSQSGLEREFEARQESLSTDPTATADSSPITEEYPTTVAAGETGVSTTDTTTTATTSTGPAGSSGASGSSGKRTPRWPSLAKGDALAIIELPTLHKRVYAVAGVAPKDLKRGLGHYPGTPLPGQLGNAAFAGHRTTYGAPLFNIDKLRVGDEIIVRTLLREQFVYIVSANPRVINSQDASVIATTDRTVASLTLTSCHPKYSAKQRIVVTAVLDPAQSGIVQEATPEVDPPARSDAPEPTADGGASEPGSPPASDAPPTATDGPTITAGNNDGVIPDTTAATDITGTGTEGTDGNGDGLTDAATPDDQVIGQTPGLSSGWFSDTGAWWDVILWALADLVIVAGGWLLARRTKRRWIGAVVAIIPFLLVLYFVYQNVNRLLPSDL